MRLLLNDIRVPLGSHLLDINLVLEGQAIALMGPSGAGKTSLLDVIAGLRQARSARVQLDERLLTNVTSGVLVPPRSRGIGYVPQDLALFPHLSVRDNLFYGTTRVSPTDLRTQSDPILEALELARLLDRRPSALSGGEKQRVALGRALLSAPSLLLLDEPLASLDTALKERVFPYLEWIRDHLRVPMIYVTHDPREAVRIAEGAVVLREGKAVFQGSVAEAVTLS